MTGASPPLWHARPFAEIAAELRSDVERGLAPDALPPLPPPEAEPERRRSAAGILVEQLRGVLLVAMLVMLALGHPGDAAAIAAAVALSVLFGTVTDYRAERSLEALRTLTAATARVVRGGLEDEVPADAVRPGDLLVLCGGQI